MNELIGTAMGLLIVIMLGMLLVLFCFVTYGQVHCWKNPTDIRCKRQNTQEITIK